MFIWEIGVCSLNGLTCGMIKAVNDTVVPTGVKFNNVFFFTQEVVPTGLKFK